MGQQQSHTPTNNSTVNTSDTPTDNSHVYTKMTQEQYQQFQKFLQKDNQPSASVTRPTSSTNHHQARDSKLPSVTAVIGSTPISQLPTVSSSSNSNSNTRMGAPQNNNNNYGNTSTTGQPSTRTVTSKFSQLQQERIYSQPNSTYHPQPRMDMVLQQRGQQSNFKDQYQNIFQQRQFDANAQYYNTMEYHGQVDRQRNIFEVSQRDMNLRHQHKNTSQPLSELPNPSSKLPNPSSKLPNPSSKLPNPSSKLPKPRSNYGKHAETKNKFRSELDKFSEKYDAHALLGLVKGAAPKEIEKAYRRQAMKVHPDRGGSQEAFTLLTKAYLSLLQQHKNERSNRMNYQEMKHESQDYIEEQGRGGPAPLGTGQGFDRNKFNKLFDETRLEEVIDEGYSEWIQQNPSNTNNTVNGDMFTDKFSLNVFNSTFEKQRNSQDETSEENRMIHYSEPSAAPMGKINFTELGESTITDFGKTSSLEDGKALGYTDYRKAMTRTHLLNVQDRNSKREQYRDVDELEKARESISFEMDSTQQQHYNEWQQHEVKLENMRQQRVKTRDTSINDRFQDVQRSLLGSEYKCLTANSK
jgi:curved DNA-binding protein CbpA